VQGNVVIVQRGAVRGGVSAAVSAPTGDSLGGLGMGHVMAMPSLWATVARGALTFGVTAGAGHALGGDTRHHEHGSWPLVDPMNLSEVTWSAGADIVLAPQLSVGANTVGAVPIGDGTMRLASGVRATWTAGRVATGFEVQAGLAGDPFRFRGVVATSVRF
jgi:hypothetical protein